MKVLGHIQRGANILVAIEKQRQDPRDYDRAVAADDGSRVRWEDLAVPNTR